MEDRRIADKMTLAVSTLSATTQLIRINQQINKLYKTKMAIKEELLGLDLVMAELATDSKALQIKILEDNNSITKCPDFTSKKKLLTTKKKQPADVCPSDVTKFLDSLDSKSKELFVANLLRKA